MTREEWYKHKTIDNVISVSEYVQIILDNPIYTDMPIEKIQRLDCLLAELQYDIGKQLKSRTVAGYSQSYKAYDQEYPPLKA